MKAAVESSGTKTTNSGVEVVIETAKSIKPKPRPRATVEEVEDSDDERELAPPRKTFDHELPFKDVEPLQDAPRTEVLPRKPVEQHQNDTRIPGKRKPRAPRNTEAEDRANEGLLSSIRDVMVPVKLGDLFDSNPKIRRALVSDMSKTRRPDFVKTTEGGVLAAKVSNFMVRSVPADDDDSPRSDDDNLEEEETSVRLVETELMTLDQDGNIIGVLLFDTFPEIVTSAGHDLAEGSIIIGDPALQYFESLGPGQKPRDIKVSMGLLSGKLRCLYPKIRGIQVEAINDSGSQIVSASLETATKMGMNWDPNLTILMEAANKQVQRTLGLARNVPFDFGEITVYLQVHILRHAPYEILLGRPFEILAETVIASKRNGDVEVTITDPYSGKRSTLQTYPRGYMAELEKSKASTESEKKPAVPSREPQDF